MRITYTVSPCSSIFGLRSAVGTPGPCLAKQRGHCCSLVATSLLPCFSQAKSIGSSPHLPCTAVLVCRTIHCTRSLMEMPYRFKSPSYMAVPTQTLEPSPRPIHGTFPVWPPVPRRVDCVRLAVPGLIEFTRVHVSSHCYNTRRSDTPSDL